MMVFIGAYSVVQKQEEEVLKPQPEDMSLTMTLSLRSAHGASRVYPGTSSIQVCCAVAPRVLLQMMMMVRTKRGTCWGRITSND